MPAALGWRGISKSPAPFLALPSPSRVLRALPEGAPHRTKANRRAINFRREDGNFALIKASGIQGHYLADLERAQGSATGGNHVPRGQFLHECTKHFDSVLQKPLSQNVFRKIRLEEHDASKKASQ